jgi:hypothetical protein
LATPRIAAKWADDQAPLGDQVLQHQTLTTSLSARTEPRRVMALGPLQLAGGVLILLGIFVARPCAAAAIRPPGP